MNLHLPNLDGWNDDFVCRPVGVPVLLYHVDWIDPDFCPEGVIEGYWDDSLSCWIGAVWNACQDVWDTSHVVPSHWRYMPQGPNL